MHRGAFCQFSFQWIHYYGSNKSTGLETGKSHPKIAFVVLCSTGVNYVPRSHFKAVVRLPKNVQLETLLHWVLILSNIQKIKVCSAEALQCFDIIKTKDRRAPSELICKVI